MRKIGLGLVFIFVLCVPALAALTFPALTGRVVDDAHILSSQTVARLDSALADYERGTTNQVVVVTVPSLQGTSIEDYGYQLGRSWAIGEKDKNNGILLIVAPTEHKVRIEVGYGLEGVMTDALSSRIIQDVILPKFRSGNMEQGIAAGTYAIIDILGGKSLPPPHRVQHGGSPSLFLGLFILFIVMRVLFSAQGGSGLLTGLLLGSAMRSNSSGSDFGGGGFSGGGGSFGGGGSSGSW